MIPYPLTRPNRLKLARVFATIPRVDISIDCIVENQMGSAFVDSTDNPQLFMVEQDGFFCYFAGDVTTAAGCDFMAKCPGGRMLMAGCPGWLEAAPQVFGERLIQIKRWTYASDTLSAAHLQHLAAANPNTPAVRQIDEVLAGMDSPYFSLGSFGTPQGFVERGIGFCLLKDNIIIGGAYSSLVCSDGIEISIVVDPSHHRQGIATALACQLLLWCLENHIDPHWDAANEESCSLAEKLGYRSEGEYAAFFLK